MWALSSSSAWGRVTAVAAMLASPGLAVRVAVRAGLPARLVAPESFRASLGAKGRAAQLATWKWGARGSPAPPSVAGDLRR